MVLVCVQAEWRWSLTSRGSQCVKETLTSRMQRWSVGSLTVGLLQSSRGRSMEKWRLQCGPKSSSVKATSLFSWTVEPQTQLETPAHLTRLLDSPAQVKHETECRTTCSDKFKVNLVLQIFRNQNVLPSYYVNGMRKGISLSWHLHCEWNKLMIAHDCPIFGDSSATWVESFNSSHHLCL